MKIKKPEAIPRIVASVDDTIRDLKEEIEILRHLRKHLEKTLRRQGRARDRTEARATASGRRFGELTASRYGKGMSHEMRLLRKEIGSVDEAVELGWLPDFWQGDTSYDGPVCPECGKEHLFAAATGDWELKPGIRCRRRRRIGVYRDQEGGEHADPEAEVRLGQIVATPGALEALEESGQSPGFFLDRHVQGDWGECRGGPASERRGTRDRGAASVGVPDPERAGSG